MSMSIDDFFAYANLYDVRHKIVYNARGEPIAGRIRRDYTIDINPMLGMQEQALTYVHELLHAHYDYDLGIEMPDSEIERMAREYYHENPMTFYKLLLSNLNQPSAEIEELDSQ